MTGKLILSGDDSFGLVYKSGEWNVFMSKEVDKNHHLANKDSTVDEKENIEFHGDLNRCIAALRNMYRDMYDKDKELKLRRTYIGALKSFENFSKIKFEEKHEVNAPSVVLDGFDYNIKTNKNHHGITVTYMISTNSAKSESGFTTVTHATPNWPKAAERVLGIEFGEYLLDAEGVSFDDAVTFLESLSKHFTNQIAEVIDV